MLFAKTVQIFLKNFPAGFGFKSTPIVPIKIIQAYTFLDDFSPKPYTFSDDFSPKNDIFSDEFRVLIKVGQNSKKVEKVVIDFQASFLVYLPITIKSAIVKAFYIGKFIR